MVMVHDTARARCDPATSHAIHGPDHLVDVQARRAPGHLTAVCGQEQARRAPCHLAAIHGQVMHAALQTTRGAGGGMDGEALSPLHLPVDIAELCDSVTPKKNIDKYVGDL